MEYSASGERLLEIASQLFYAEGIGAIGVDRVAEEAGISKPTLYAQFKNKAGLVAAVLQRRRKTWERIITSYVEALPRMSRARFWH
ncbi:helix-turn-helix domain-containing protein [Corynebacterium sp.]|uniref:TetR/AcrR family transcriptional regulator n=1 Tax=Corynebacterium sp. TaxID=1720 RepID=UPI00257CA0DC|nr:helix-turn-helix domain-containing protein [Corynebacterium sp.]